MYVFCRFILFVIFISPGFAFSEVLVPFDADVESSCTINMRSPGLMVLNGFSLLSSGANGGRSAKVDIFTTGTDFRVFLNAPERFRVSPAGVGSVMFDASYSSSGATHASGVAGNDALKLGLGVSNISIDLNAEASGFVFPNGHYSADVTVICE